MKPDLPQRAQNPQRKKESDNKLTEIVIGCAIEVHRTLGPGLLENTYEKCLTYELTQQNISHKLQVPLPVKYKNVSLECGYKLDILVEGCLILELKSVDRLSKIHEAQILTYLKLANISTGLLINFNETKLVNGLKRFKT